VTGMTPREATKASEMAPQFGLAPTACAWFLERNRTDPPPDRPLASRLPVQDARFLLLELGLGQDASL
jgi:hypothetical protein